MLPKNSKLLFRGIVGSQSYGLATETSDTDYKSIYMQNEEDILCNSYTPQIEIDKDDTAYELRRFLELVSTGNPNVLELLFLPEDCIINTSPEYEYLRSIRKEFLSKKCYNTYSGYAKTQLQKATGLNKKFNWEENRVVRKDILDFCKIIDKENGKTFKLKDWLKAEGYSQNQCGLTSVDGFRDIYKLYVDDIQWVNDNHRFNFENRQYKGIADENTNEPRCSVIEQYRVNDWKGIVYFNREYYSTHCKEYREYQKWLKNRNENRVATNKAHGQQYDSKNILHLIRLIMTAEEIPLLNTINVNRSKEREYLLSIKKGALNLKEVIEEWRDRANKLSTVYKNSNLKEDVTKEFTNNIELKIRKNEL